MLEEPSYFIIDSLAHLHGPDKGEISLPKRLFWNPSQPFNLSDDKRAATLIRIVLLEARRKEDLEEFINPELLKRLWHRIHLPEYIRNAWEQKFPELVTTQT